MVNLKRQYLEIKTEIDAAIQQTLLDGDFIKGKKVQVFEEYLANYTGLPNVISCGNGTDALLLAIMALQLPKGSKIIVPAFTYIAPAEVVSFLGFELVFADVDAHDFNITLATIKEVYTPDVSAIIIVHLFGLPCTDVVAIHQFCSEKNIPLIEDNAQALGAEKEIKRDSIFTVSFFPTKNLGAYGDGGAVLCKNNKTAALISKMATHGQSQKYIHDIVGINSRLDTLQASILLVKAKTLTANNERRRKHASLYQEHLQHIKQITLPQIREQHIFHQYTLKIKDGRRNELATYLAKKGIATVVNYPLPVYKQNAYQQELHLKNTEELCSSVLSIPIFPELTAHEIMYICTSIKTFFE